MSRFTPSQQQAIELKGRNILVSAGAGSGKTTVLSQRVIRLLKDGYTLDRMLILTFTKNAAENMKIKIKALLKGEPTLLDQLKLVDGADIMTFDAFNQKIVKKYSDQLRINEDFSIVNQTTIKAIKRQFLEERFKNYYLERQTDFLRLLDAYTEKDDEVIIDFITRIEEGISLMSDPEEYLFRVIADPGVAEPARAYQRLLEHYQRTLRNYLVGVSRVLPAEDNYLLALSARIEPLIEAKSFDQLQERLAEIKRLPSLRNADDETRSQIDYLVKTYYKAVKKEVAEIIGERAFENIYLHQKKSLNLIYQEVTNLRNYLQRYKAQRGIYEFTDIAQMVLRLLRSFPDIREEVRQHYQEIMVDEYQDNSDLQEAVIDLLDNHNLFLVGDIKQSIYRFRNANPKLFAARYSLYKSHPECGAVIDMNENFRSSPAVVDEVNKIFSQAMTERFGGANYSQDHIITAANPNYQGVAFRNRFLKIAPENGGSDSEVEIRAIAADIKRRVAEDNCSFSDFCLLVDRGTEFNNIIRIFADQGIPLAVSLNGDLTSYQMTAILIDLLVVMRGVEQNQIGDSKFRHAFAAVSRSLIYEMSDQAIYDYLHSDLKDSIVYQDFAAVLSKTRGYPFKYQFAELLKKLEVVARVVRGADVETDLKLIDAFQTSLSELGLLGYSLDEAIDYFRLINETGTRYLTKLESNSKNAVTLSNIHMSKGLEYNHCYFLLLGKRYNEGDYRNRFKFTARYGAILPIVRADFRTADADIPSFISPLDRLYIIEEKAEDRAERLRLLYVALTRAKLTMTLVETPQIKTVTAMAVEDCKNFFGILFATGVYRRAELRESLPCREENRAVEDSASVDLKYVYREYHPQEIATVKPHRASGSKVHRSKTWLEQGTRLHQILATIDLKNPNLEFIDSHLDRIKIEKFLALPLLQDLSEATIFQEYEFYDEEQEVLGAIDLLLLFEDRAVIIDYKLKDTTDPDYISQLNTYKKYISRIYQIPVEIYLYSLIEERLSSVAVLN